MSQGAYLTVCECANVREYCVILRVRTLMFVSLIKSGSVSISVYVRMCVFFDESPQIQQPAAVEQR